MSALPASSFEAAAISFPISLMETAPVSAINLLMISVTSCFPHFFLKHSKTLDFVELILENGCCKRIFGHVFAKIKESIG